MKSYYNLPNLIYHVIVKKCIYLHIKTEPNVLLRLITANGCMGE